MIGLHKTGYARGEQRSSAPSLRWPYSPCGQFRDRPVSLRGVFCVLAVHNPRVTRRQGLIASGIATVLLLLAMAPADGRMKDTGGPGIVPFELSGGQDRAGE